MDTRLFSAYNEATKKTLAEGVTVVDAAREPIKVLKVLMEGLPSSAKKGLWFTNFSGIPVARAQTPFDLVYLDDLSCVVHCVEISLDSKFEPFKGIPASALILPPKSIRSSKTFTGDRIRLTVAGELTQPAPPAVRPPTPPAHTRIVPVSSAKSYNVPQENPMRSGASSTPVSGPLMRGAHAPVLQPSSLRPPTLAEEPPSGPLTQFPPDSNVILIRTPREPLHAPEGLEGHPPSLPVEPHVIPFPVVPIAPSIEEQTAGAESAPSEILATPEHPSAQQEPHPLIGSPIESNTLATVELPTAQIPEPPAEPAPQETARTPIASEEEIAQRESNPPIEPIAEFLAPVAGTAAEAPGPAPELASEPAPEPPPVPAPQPAALELAQTAIAQKAEGTHQEFAPPAEPAVAIPEPKAELAQFEVAEAAAALEPENRQEELAPPAAPATEIPVTAPEPTPAPTPGPTPEPAHFEVAETALAAQAEIDHQELAPRTELISPPTKEPVVYRDLDLLQPVESSEPSATPSIEPFQSADDQPGESEFEPAAPEFVEPADTFERELVEQARADEPEGILALENSQWPVVYTGGKDITPPPDADRAALEQRMRAIALSQRWDVRLLYTVFPKLRPTYRPPIRAPRVEQWSVIKSKPKTKLPLTIRILCRLYPDLHFETLEQRQHEVRRAPRLATPGLVGYFYTGGRSKPAEIRDLSVMGFFMKTEERWLPGTVIRITLQTMVGDEENPGESITVHSRVVQWGPQGGGFEFVLPGFLE